MQLPISQRKCKTGLFKRTLKNRYKNGKKILNQIKMELKYWDDIES